MPPLTFSEGFAIAAGLVQLFVAAVFLRFRHGRPEWGLGWWGTTYLGAGAMNTAAPVLLAAMYSPLGVGFQLLTLVLGVSAMGALVAGGRLYTGHVRPGPWASFGLTWLAYLAGLPGPDRSPPLVARLRKPHGQCAHRPHLCLPGIPEPGCDAP